MSQLSSIAQSVNSDHIYFDLTLKNFQSTTQESNPLIFNERRNTSFLPNSGEYYMSIIRFQLDTYSLPVFVADIQPNQGNSNLMIHSVTLEYVTALGVKTSAGPTYLNWNPVNKYINTPIPPSSNPNGMQTDSPYYYAYSFEHLVSLVNSALLTNMNLLKVAVGGIGGIDPPFLGWDEVNKIASIYADVDHFNITAATARINIYFNRPLFALFNSFMHYKYNINSTNNQIYQMRMENNNGLNLTADELLPGNHTWIKLTQEYSTISNWTPVSSIVFTSNTLPINQSQLSSPIIINNGVLVSSNENNAFASIITDLVSDELCYRPNLLYNPTSEYRLIDLRGNQPLNNIDISVYWKDKYGKLNQFLLYSGGSCTIKLLFRKKTFNLAN